MNFNYIERFKRAWRETSDSFKYDFISDTEVGWTEEDGIALRNFFESAPGIKMKVKLTNYICRVALEATRATSDQQRHCGIARGVAMAVGALQDHIFAGRPRSGDNSEEQAPSVSEDLALN